MTTVGDANILLRLADPTAPLRPVALAAVAQLRATGHVLRSVPQAVYEFWVVATRPKDKNGLGLSIPDCEAEVARALTVFPLLDDQPALFAEWRSLVVAHACHGKPAHDARYVAAMNTHGVTRILTFNGADFQRYPHIVVLDPHVVAASASPPRGTSPPSP